MSNMHSLEDCYPQLHDAIIRGELMPNERLVELELAQRYGVGRAAVRTALARLEQDGLIEREPHRGARVRHVSESEAIEILEARSVLEGLAARHAAQKTSDDAIAALRELQQQMKQCLETGDLMGMSFLNTQFHEYILSIANLQTVTQLIKRLHPQHVRLQYRTILLPSRAPHSIREHDRIVDAIASHDPEAAEQAMRHHLQQTVEALRQPENHASVPGFQGY